MPGSGPAGRRRMDVMWRARGKDGGREAERHREQAGEGGIGTVGTWREGTSSLTLERP